MVTRLYAADTGSIALRDSYNYANTQLINAVPIVVKYKDTSGRSIQPDQLIMGQKADKSFVKSYLISEMLDDEGNIPESVPTYYRIGQEVSLEAPTIEGYLTPSPQVKMLSSGENVITFTYTSVPTMTAGESTTSSISVSWSPVTNISSYKLQYRVVGTTEWTTVDIADISTTAYTLENLSPNANYEAHVLGVYADNTTITSEVLNASTQPNVVDTGDTTGTNNRGRGCS